MNFYNCHTKRDMSVWLAELKMYMTKKKLDFFFPPTMMTLATTELHYKECVQAHYFYRNADLVAPIL